MDSQNKDIQEYQKQLGKGQISRAYRAIMAFMSDLCSHLQKNYPDYAASALYPGYMDMTYFAFTPPALKNKKLKIAIVYLHGENKFEAWLAGNNRKIQAEYIGLLSRKDIGSYSLSQVQPGMDSIIAVTLVEHPDFDKADGLKRQIEAKAMEFAREMEALLG